MAKKRSEAPSEAEDWIGEIARYEREVQKWEGRVETVLKRYRDEQKRTADGDESRFNILWSNVQTLVPAVFSRIPKPDVSRRYRDNDPVGRVAALLLERCLEFEVSQPDFASALEQSIRDRFLGGRGVAWVRYEPKFELMPEMGEQVTEDVEGEESEDPAEQLVAESCPVDYVHWRDFGHKIARTWEEVDAVWRVVFMDRDALIERFGDEIGSRIPLDSKPADSRNDRITGGSGSEKRSQGKIYEIWNKKTGEALWLSRSLGQIVDRKKDPLKLEDFWPLPKPLYATLTSDSLIPVPDYVLYQDQAITLDILSDRIAGLSKMLQVKGCYDASTPELGRLFTEAINGSLVPVTNWAAFAEKQGLQGSFSLVDLAPIAQALQQAYQAMEQVKGQIYEITGIADIVRGESDPRATATAEQQKAQFGTLRLRDTREKIARFASEIISIKAQIICRLYQPETIVQMGGAAQLLPEDQQRVPQAIALLKNATARDFRIEVQSDAMVQLDEQAEQQRRVEFLSATGQYIKMAQEAGAQSPQIVPLLVEMLKFGVTGFKVGKELEGLFDETAEKLKQAALQAQQNPQPNPEQIKMQGQMQIEHTKAQIESQKDAARLQADIQIEQARIASQERLAQQKAALDAQLATHEQEVQQQQITAQYAAEAQTKQFEAELNSRMEAQRQEHERAIAAIKEQAATDRELAKARMDNDTKIIVAAISSGSKGGEDGSSPEPVGDVLSVVNDAIASFRRSVGIVEIAQ